MINCARLFFHLGEILPRLRPQSPCVPAAKLLRLFHYHVTRSVPTKFRIFFQATTLPHRAFLAR